MRFKWSKEITLKWVPNRVWIINIYILWHYMYLRGKSDYSITYNCYKNLVYGYVDSNFVSDLDKMKYTSCYVFTLAQWPICLMSKLEGTNTLFVIEVECMVVSHACKVLIWL